MAPNPFHYPETEAVYKFREFDEDKDGDMTALMDLIGSAANTPEKCGIHQHDIREVAHGLGSVSRYHNVMYWEAKHNGARR